MLSFEPHPQLEVAVFRSQFPSPLSQIATPAEVVDYLQAQIQPPMTSDDHVRKAVRDLLRYSGYKPTGRGKPASEYLAKARAEERLGCVNAVVDTCNAVSLHSGLPISVIDLHKSAAPWKIAPADAQAQYVFNPAGQVIALSGLLCLFDADGPCANGVKDSQRTKTDGTTSQTLTVIWGTQNLPGRTTEAAQWYLQLLGHCGATSEQW